MKDKKYIDEIEENDFKRLEEFNKHVRCFSEIKPSAVKWHTDATAYTENKLGDIRYFNIEIKQRNLNLMPNGKLSGATNNGTYITDTLFIESHKVADLLLDSLNGLEPLYINFLQDGHIVIFNLNKLTKRPVKMANLNINSRGYRDVEVAKRQGLYMKDATIYDRNYKIIKHMGEEWKPQEQQKIS